MFEKNLSAEERYEILKDILIMAFFSGFAFFVNNGIRISGLYMDDLYMWSCYGEQSFREYVFPLGSTRFRPVYWFIAWLQLGIIKNNITLIVPMNIIFAAVLASLIYVFVKKLSNSALLGFSLGILFLASRFSYYNISQLLGLMEALALLFVFYIIKNLYTYLEIKDIKKFYYAIVFYILVCFTHERFMVFLPIFIFVLLINKSKNIIAYISGPLSFAFVQVIRRLTIGTLLPAGTGGTNVADTLTLKSLIESSVSEVLYIFGINAGPEHLNGLTWAQTPLILKVLNLASAVLILSYFILYMIISVSRAKKEKSLWKDVLYSIFFLSFIGASIVSSAVTIRVEMRWVYAPYMFMLIYIAYMHGRISSYLKGRKTGSTMAVTALILLWAVLNLPFEFYSHGKYDKIYLFPNQKIYNSLADVSYNKYKDAIFGKTVYIIGNSFEMSNFTAETFFKVYKNDKTMPDVKVEHVDSIKDLPVLEEGDIVLQEDSVHKEFVDVSRAVKEIRLRSVYGYYSDGWMDENASIEVMSGDKGIIRFEIMYPGNLTDNENVYISYDDRVLDIDLKENITNVEIQSDPNRIVRFDFKNNFYFPNALEQRGEDKLSVIVNVSVE
jgi:hypothetical protein